VLPTFLVGGVNRLLPLGRWGKVVLEAVLKVAIFLTYMVGISKMKEIHRVFEYHGAEHKTIACYEAGDPLTVVNNLSTFIFGLIRAVGLILLGWGIVQVGLSLQSHDPSQRSNGFLTLAGGIVITFAKEILDLIIA